MPIVEVTKNVSPMETPTLTTSVVIEELPIRIDLSSSQITTSKVELFKVLNVPKQYGDVEDESVKIELRKYSLPATNQNRNHCGTAQNAIMTHPWKELPLKGEDLGHDQAKENRQIKASNIRRKLNNMSAETTDRVMHLFKNLQN